MAKEVEPTGKFAFVVQTGREITPQGTINTGFIAASDEHTAVEYTDHMREVHGVNLQRRTSIMSEVVSRSVGMPGENGWGAKWQPSGPEGGTAYSRAMEKIQEKAARANEN